MSSPRLWPRSAVPDKTFLTAVYALGYVYIGPDRGDDEPLRCKALSEGPIPQNLLHDGTAVFAAAGSPGITKTSLKLPEPDPENLETRSVGENGSGFASKEP